MVVVLCQLYVYKLQDRMSASLLYLQYAWNEENGLESKSWFHQYQFVLIKGVLIKHGQYWPQILAY